MSPKKGRYSGAYRDSKDRIRPITPRKRSGAKTGVPVKTKSKNTKKRKGTSDEYKEFKRYIALSPSPQELHLTEKEIAAHPRLSSKEKNLLYQYIRARSGNMPQPPTEAIEIEGFMLVRELSGEWVHLYPRVQGDLPTIHKTRAEAEEYANRLKQNMNIETKILPASEALKYEIPPRQDHGGVLDPQERSFKTVGKRLAHGWTKTADGPADAKAANANAVAKEFFGVMTLTIPSLDVPGKFVVYYRNHPESKPPEAEFSLARKMNQNVLMWNNKQWEWSYSQKKWLQQSDMTTGEDKGRLLGEPGEMVVTRRYRGLGSDEDRGKRGKIIYTEE